jgi:hypothetical protein
MLKTVGFADIQAILDRAIGDVGIGAHGAFWRDISRDEFVVKKVFGRTLVLLGSSPESNLVLALSGVAPFGKDIGTVDATMRRMPAGMAEVPAEDIATIAQWIDDGCPT